MQGLIVTDLEPVALTCGLDGNGELVLYHEGNQVTDGKLVILLKDLTATHVTIADFVHEGTALVSNAASIAADGTMTNWPREGQASVLQPVSHNNGAEVTIDTLVTATSDNSAMTAREQAFAIPAVVQSQLRIRVRKDGDKPTV